MVSTEYIILLGSRSIDVKLINIKKELFDSRYPPDVERYQHFDQRKYGQI